MFYAVSAKDDVFGAAVFVRFVGENLNVFEGFALQTPSGAVFAEGQALKSQTALGNRWPGAATSDQELNANIKPRFRPALYEV